MDAAVYFGRDAQIVRAWTSSAGCAVGGGVTVRHPRSVRLRKVVISPGRTTAAAAPPDRNLWSSIKIVRPENKVLTGKNGLAEAIYATRVRYGLNEPLLADIQEACLNDSRRVRELLDGDPAGRRTSGTQRGDPRIGSHAGDTGGPGRRTLQPRRVEEAPRFLELLALHSRAEFPGSFRSSSPSPSAPIAMRPCKPLSSCPTREAWCSTISSPCRRGSSGRSSKGLRGAQPRGAASWRSA